MSDESRGCNDGPVVPFVFLAAVAGSVAYFVRGGRPQGATAIGALAPTSIGAGASTRREPVGIRGWLLLYMVGLAAELAHDLALTVGSLVIYAKPSLAGLHSLIPLWALLIYVAGSLGLVAYGVVLFALMARERNAAIANNVAFNVLSVVFLVIWFALGAKSPVGTVVDALPGLAAIAYFTRSRRARNTFTIRARP